MRPVGTAQKSARRRRLPAAEEPRQKPKKTEPTDKIKEKKRKQIRPTDRPTDESPVVQPLPPGGCSNAETVEPSSSLWPLDGRRPMAAWLPRFWLRPRALTGPGNRLIWLARLLARLLPPAGVLATPITQSAPFRGRCQLWITRSTSCAPLLTDSGQSAP